MQQAHHVIPIADLPEQEDFVQHVDEFGWMFESILPSVLRAQNANKLLFLFDEPGPVSLMRQIDTAALRASLILKYITAKDLG